MATGGDGDEEYDAHCDHVVGWLAGWLLRSADFALVTSGRFTSGLQGNASDSLVDWLVAWKNN